jgi:SulP family sulfate permease
MIPTLNCLLRAMPTSPSRSWEEYWLATGAIARTATNIKSGARTPVSGMVHALTLIVILLVAAPLARFIPLATLAAILFVVAYNMSEWREVSFLLGS